MDNTVKKILTGSICALCITTSITVHGALTKAVGTAAKGFSRRPSGMGGISRAGTSRLPSGLPPGGKTVKSQIPSGKPVKSLIGAPGEVPSRAELGRSERVGEYRESKAERAETKVELAEITRVENLLDILLKNDRTGNGLIASLYKNKKKDITKAFENTLAELKQNGKSIILLDAYDTPESTHFVLELAGIDPQEIDSITLQWQTLMYDGFDVFELILFPEGSIMMFVPKFQTGITSFEIKSPPTGLQTFPLFAPTASWFKKIPEALIDRTMNDKEGKQFLETVVNYLKQKIIQKAEIATGELKAKILFFKKLLQRTGDLNIDPAMQTQLKDSITKIEKSPLLTNQAIAEIDKLFSEAEEKISKAETLKVIEAKKNLLKEINEDTILSPAKKEQLKEQLKKRATLSGIENVREQYKAAQQKKLQEKLGGKKPSPQVTAPEVKKPVEVIPKKEAPVEKPEPRVESQAPEKVISEQEIEFGKKAAEKSLPLKKSKQKLLKEINESRFLTLKEKAQYKEQLNQKLFTQTKLEAIKKNFETKKFESLVAEMLENGYDPKYVDIVREIASPMNVSELEAFNLNLDEELLDRLEEADLRKDIDKIFQELQAINEEIKTIEQQKKSAQLASEKQQKAIASEAERATKEMNEQFAKRITEAQAALKKTKEFLELNAAQQEQELEKLKQTTQEQFAQELANKKQAIEAKKIKNIEDLEKTFRREIKNLEKQYAELGRQQTRGQATYQEQLRELQNKFAAQTATVEAQEKLDELTFQNRMEEIKQQKEDALKKISVGTEAEIKKLNEQRAALEHKHTAIQQLRQEQQKRLEEAQRGLQQAIQAENDAARRKAEEAINEAQKKLNAAKAHVLDAETTFADSNAARELIDKESAKKQADLYNAQQAVTTQEQTIQELKALQEQIEAQQKELQKQLSQEQRVASKAQAAAQKAAQAAKLAELQEALAKQKADELAAKEAAEKALADQTVAQNELAKAQAEQETLTFAAKQAETNFAEQQKRLDELMREQMNALEKVKKEATAPIEQRIQQEKTLAEQREAQAREEQAAREQLREIPKIPIPPIPILIGGGQEEEEEEKAEEQPQPEQAVPQEKKEKLKPSRPSREKPEIEVPVIAVPTEPITAPTIQPEKEVEKPVITPPSQVIPSPEQGVMPPTPVYIAPPAGPQYPQPGTAYRPPTPPTPQPSEAIPTAPTSYEGYTPAPEAITPQPTTTTEFPTGYRPVERITITKPPSPTVTKEIEESALAKEEQAKPLTLWERLLQAVQTGLPSRATVREFLANILGTKKAPEITPETKEAVPPAQAPEEIPQPTENPTVMFIKSIPTKIGDMVTNAFDYMKKLFGY